MQDITKCYINIWSKSKIYLIGIFVIMASTTLWPSEPPGVLEIPAFDIIYGDFDLPEYASPGEVVSFHPRNREIVIRSEFPYDPSVCGVIATDSTGEFRIAIAGEVDLLIDPSVREVRAGEWLVTSGATGTAMPIQEDYPFDAVVLGAALTGFTEEDSTNIVRAMLTVGERISPKSIRDWGK